MIRGVDDLVRNHRVEAVGDQKHGQEERDRPDKPLLIESHLHHDSDGLCDECEQESRPIIVAESLPRKEVQRN